MRFHSFWLDGRKVLADLRVGWYAEWSVDFSRQVSRLDPPAAPFHPGTGSVAAKRIVTPR